MTRELHLLRGQVTRVDDADYPWLSTYAWRLNSGGYAVRTATFGTHKRILCLHRELLQVPRGLVVDHVDHDKLNNTRDNLRIITQQQNLQYRRCFRNNRSGYKGVTAQHGQYHARIHVDGRAWHLGFYDAPETAAKVYDAAARQLFGPFALVNFPDEATDPEIEVRLLPLLSGIAG